MAVIVGSAAVLFVNAAGEVLLRLRDDRPDLIFANQWDLIGGALEPGETIRQAAVREVEEEIGLRVETLVQLGRYQGSVLVEVFVALLEPPLERITLLEGQRLEFFAREAATQLELVPWVRAMLADVAQRESEWAALLRSLRT